MAVFVEVNHTGIISLAEEKAPNGHSQRYKPGWLEIFAQKRSAFAFMFPNQKLDLQLHDDHFTLLFLHPCLCSTDTWSKEGCRETREQSQRNEELS